VSSVCTVVVTFESNDIDGKKMLMYVGEIGGMMNGEREVGCTVDLELGILLGRFEDFTDGEREGECVVGDCDGLRVGVDDGFKVGETTG